MSIVNLTVQRKMISWQKKLSQSESSVSSNVMRARPQFAPNDPYFSTVGGQPSVPWSDDSHTHRYTRAVTQVGVVLHNV